MLLGIYGGTFDPPHLGHLAVSRTVRDALGLDCVLWVPAGDPWQKAGAVVAAPEHRLAMVRLTIADEIGLDGRMDVSTIELDRPGPTFTVDTLRALAGPGRQLVLVLGADAAAGVDSWHEAEQIRRLASIAVVSRTGVGPKIRDAQLIQMPPVDVSAREIRRRLSGRLSVGEDVAGMLVPAVSDYIWEHGLYRPTIQAI